jgi:serine/threonine protein kinase
LSSFELVGGLSDNAHVPVDLFAHRADSWQIALKSFPELSLDEEEIFWREVHALVRLDHPCIIPFFGFVLQIPPRGPRIATHFIAGGSLKEVLVSQPAPWTGTAKSIVVAGIVAGMAFAHESGIVHRDLKPSHILLDENYRPRICDFGSSRDQSLSAILTETVGAPPHAVLELSEDADYDVFSFALILYEIVVGQPAFSPLLAFPQLYQKLKTQDERPNIPAAIEPFVAELIRHGWSANAAERLSFHEMFEELRSHAFCVVRDEFNRADVTAYVAWIGASSWA